MEVVVRFLVKQVQFRTQTFVPSGGKKYCFICLYFFNSFIDTKSFFWFLNMTLKFNWLSETVWENEIIWAQQHNLKQQRPAHTVVPNSLDKISQFSLSLVSYSLQPNGLQHPRLPCPSPSPRACSNTCPLSLWCHPTKSSFVVPFFFCLQNFPVSGSPSVTQIFSSGGQNIGVSASALQMNIRTDFLSVQFSSVQ